MTAAGRSSQTRRPLHLRDVVNERRRQLLPEDVYPIEPWRLVELRFEPRFLPQTETLFCTSNGYLGIRATPEEGTPVHEQGTYLNGFYETWPIAYGEEAYGFAKTGQTMLNVPDGTLLKLYVDDEPFDISRVNLLSFHRILDFRSGTLDRSLSAQLPDGRRIAIRTRRFTSLEHRHLACIHYQVEMLEGHASLVLSSELGLHPPHATVDPEDPRRTENVDHQALAMVDHRARERRLVFNLETRSSGLRMACGMDHLVEAEIPIEVEEAESQDERGRVVFLADAAPGQRICITKFLAYHHSASEDSGELRFRANRTLDRAIRDGYESVLASHRQRVDDFWERADVLIEGEPEVQQAVRFNLFQIFQASARIEDYGIPAKGLTGLGYEGHYFWDTEIYVLPLLVYTAPWVARSLLQLRVGQLPQARARAAAVSQKGALFPWRTINGEEASAYYAASTAQYHINADVVYAAQRYLSLTQDLPFLDDGFAEMAVETARLWADLGFYSERQGGRFCINGVTGPDEYNTVVNNNAYTNLMAQENLRIAIRTVETLRRRAPDAFARLKEATALDLDELDEWRRAADAMYVPFDEEARVHLQDDGFLDREVWDFERTPPEHYPLLLHYHPLVIYRHQVIKQADLVLATFLVGHAFTEEEKRRIFDYYDPLTTGDSSLSVCIQSIVAAELGYADRAYRYFADAVAMDLGDIGGNVRDGLHVSSLGGTWLALIYGFAGLRDRNGELRFRPRLPDGWTRLRFRLRLRGNDVEVDVGREETCYRLLQGEGLRIWHGEKALDLAPGATASEACFD